MNPALPTAPRRTAVVTGASSGIGRATAIAFAEQGWSVVLAARGAEALDEAAADCRARGAEALAVPTDVSDAAAVKALRDAAIERFGGIDVWVNNVGTGAVGRFDEVPIEAHQRVVAASLLGHMNGAHAVVPHFRERRRGVLVNMVSIGGWTPTPLAASYSASKWGLRGFSEALRAELADLPGVHVCEVAPVLVDTPGIGHGANYSGRRLKLPPGAVAPERVAAEMVALADRPRARTFVGVGTTPARLAHAVAPDLVALATLRIMEWALGRSDAAPTTQGNLFEASRGTTTGSTGPVAGASTAALSGLAAVGLGAAVWLLRRER